MATAAEKHQAIVDALIAQLEAGCAPWERPWVTTGGDGLPVNLATQRKYRGSNILWLWMMQATCGYESGEWISFRQALALGGSVRKGEHGVPITFFTMLERADPGSPAGVRNVPLLKCYTVFNRAQCDGLPAPEAVEPRSEFVRLAEADAFIAAIGAEIRHGGDRAYYAPKPDAIALPNPERFDGPEFYYATSLHEHAHWSGAPHRLAREFGKRFGDNAYAFEELVAELTSAFLCAELAIPGKLRHAEYLAHWASILRDDPRALLTAGSRASAAADYLMALAGRRPSESTIVDDGGPSEIAA